MNCRQVVELMTEYLEGTLPAADRQRFEQHLAGCDGCTRYLEQLRVSLKVMGRLGQPQAVPEDVERELLRAFRDWRAKP
jgi:anti-sigma factor RsiW